MFLLQVKVKKTTMKKMEKKAQFNQVTPAIERSRSKSLRINNENENASASKNSLKRRHDEDENRPKKAK